MMCGGRRTARVGQEETAAAAWSGRDAYQAVVFPSPLALLGAGERFLLTVGYIIIQSRHFPSTIWCRCVYLFIDVGGFWL